MLVEGWQPAILIGDDFRFGCDRRGDYELLQAAGEQHGFVVTDTRTFELEGERVSSTRVRQRLEASDFARAQELLGKPYRMSGRVGYGQQLGRRLGADCQCAIASLSLAA